MLKNKNGGADHQPWQEVMPWIDLVTPGLMLCKDGSLLACFDYIALDPDNIEDALIDSCTGQLERAFNTFDTRFCAWVIATKVRDRTYPQSKFNNQTSKDLDDHIKTAFDNGQFYSITHRIYISYTGNTGVSKFMDSVNTLMSEQGASLPVAVLKAMNPAYASRSAVLHDMTQLESNILEMESALKSFVGVLSDVRMTRREGWDFETALALEANVTAPPTTMYNKPIGTLFDGWVNQSEISVGKDLIKVAGVTEHKYVAQLSVKEYPSQLTSLMLEGLLISGREIKICHAIKFLDQDAARKEIDSALEYYNMTRYSLMSRAMNKAFGGEMTPRPGKQDLYNQCMEAKRRQITDNLGFMMHTMSVSVYGDTIRDCENNVTRAAQQFSANNFSIMRERLNLTCSFASMLPGQWATQTRLNLQNSEVVSDCLPIYTLDPGPARHPYFSKEVYGADVPAFSVFQNLYGGKSNFHPHVGQVGHMLIIAPTGGGKTTFVNFELSQFQRYERANTIIFDRDHSCRITTLLHGGTHMDMRTGNMKLNPLFALRDGSEDGLIWCREFILRRLTEGGYESTAEDRLELDSALMSLQQLGQPVSLSVLATQLPNHLSLQLGEWLTGRPYGAFDSYEDDFELSSWTCIEMKEIMAVERVARAFLDYAFRKISMSLDGRPTFIYLEEASFLLNHPSFADVIDDWLKTLRKKNAFLWMTIQSPASVTNSKISATLLDNVKSIMVLANKKVEAHRPSYIQFFGMTDAQVDMVAGLQPAREYMVIKDGTCRKLRTQFDEHSLAYLRSEVGLQAKFDAHRNSGAPDWKRNYLEQATRGN